MNAFNYRNKTLSLVVSPSSILSTFHPDTILIHPFLHQTNKAQFIHLVALNYKSALLSLAYVMSIEYEKPINSEKLTKSNDNELMNLKNQ